MTGYGGHELIVIAAVVTLAAAWLKLMRQKGDPRLIAACGLLAYFLPVMGPVAALVVLNVYDRRKRAKPLPQRSAAVPKLALASEGA